MSTDPQKDNAYKAIQTLLAFLRSEAQMPKYATTLFLFQLLRLKKNYSKRNLMIIAKS